MSLSLRQEAILRYIYEYSRIQGYPPSMREIASLLGCSVSTADFHVKVLIGNGLLSSVSEKHARTLILTDAGMNLLTKL